MTIAICYRCESQKFGAFVPCKACGFLPSADYDMAYALALTDHHLPKDVLAQIGKTIKSGAEPPKLDETRLGGRSRAARRANREWRGLIDPRTRSPGQAESRVSMNNWLHPEAQDVLRANSEDRPPLLDRKNIQTWSGPEGTNPLFEDGDALMTFDYAVANMPFSDKRWSTELHPNEGGGSTGSGEQPVTDYGRFAGYGIQS